MTYVITLTDLVPPPRFDGIAWDVVKVAEAATDAGPWTNVIATLGLVPPDTDPDAPLARSFTVGGAALQTGWYRVTFEDGDGNTQDTDPFQLDSYNANWIPTRYNVGALLRARTMDSHGNEVGTFNDDTRPDGMGSDRAINIALGDVTATTGHSLDEQVWDIARSVISIKAAMLIELSYFPEQVARGNSPYDQYERMYKEQMANLINAIDQVNNGDPIGPGGGQASHFLMPADAGGMIGWGSRW